MTQASSNVKPTPSLGAAAAAAATTPASGAKPTDAKPDDKKDEAKKERNGSKVYVVVGTVHEFESVNKAEKFLNGEGAPTDYAVVRGKKISKSTKVSLR